MRINKIKLHNFRQYYDTVEIDLKTDENKNIVLIGGKNGFGKTNLLIALVWCLYGDKIENIDDNFKKEIRKEKNFAQFIKQTLNWDAQKKGKSKFFVELHLSEIELPEFSDISQNKYYHCILKREFDINTMQDNLDISFPDIKTDFLSTNEAKIDFINDYIVPIEAAKFVFFDAEKIASLAELNTKEEGEFMNDALGKLLGLDIYSSLINDLEIYCSSLKKEGANENIREQITNAENGIRLNENQIENIENEIFELETFISKKKFEIKEYEAFLNEHSKKALKSYNREELLTRKQKLLEVEKQFEKKFNELSEIIPYAIAAGTLEEVNEHLIKQEFSKNSNEDIEVFKSKFDNFIENLFNKEPHESSMTFKAKSFYFSKAQDLFKTVFNYSDTENTEDLQFEHDLNNADKELVKEAYKLIIQQSQEVIQQTIEGYNRTKNEIQELTTIISQIDADLQDEIIIEYTIKKEDAERIMEKKIAEKGAKENQKERLKSEIIRLNQKLQVLNNKIEARDKLKLKLDKTNQYIKSLTTFLDIQKKNKEINLAKSIHNELKKLMHKLQDNESFIADVKVHALPDNGGLKVTLYNSDGNQIPKENLSQGEKQLYISSLLKAILQEAIQDFPIFIDTPLGRLDHEHINNMLLSYYPYLAKQVVILATNNEIPPSRYKLIENEVANAYLLINKENKTIVQSGYFQGYEN